MESYGSSVPELVGARELGPGGDAGGGKGIGGIGGWIRVRLRQRSYCRKSIH